MAPRRSHASARFPYGSPPAGPGPGACSDPAAGWLAVSGTGMWAQPASRRGELLVPGHVGQAEYTFPCSGPRNLCSEADMIHRNPLRRSYSHREELFNAARVVHARICFLRSRGNRGLVSSSMFMFSSSWVITHAWSWPPLLLPSHGHTQLRCMQLLGTCKSNQVALDLGTRRGAQRSGFFSGICLRCS